MQRSYRKFKRRKAERRKSVYLLALVPFAGFFFINANNPTGSTQDQHARIETVCVEQAPVTISNDKTAKQAAYFSMPEPEIPVLFEPENDAPEFVAFQNKTEEKTLSIDIRNWPKGLTDCVITDLNGYTHTEFSIHKRKEDGVINFDLPGTVESGMYWLELRYQRLSMKRSFRIETRS